MIHDKLYKFQSEVGRIKKDKTNPHFKNSYANLNSVYDAIKPILHLNKIVPSHTMEVIEGKNILHTVLIDIEDNTSITSSTVLQDGLDAQKTMGATTYFKRMALVSMLCLEAVDDDGKVGSNSIKENKVPTEDMVLQIEALMNGDAKFKAQWLNFLGVKSFDKVNYGQLEKAIGQLS